MNVEYVKTIKDLNDYIVDMHGHLVVKHDLFSHENMTKQGIAEAFIEFLKKENLYVGKH